MAYRKSGSGFRMEIFSPLCGDFVAAESISRELLEIAHIVINDKRTNDDMFPMVMNKFLLINKRDI
jgi:hypothetical protein